MLLEQEREAHLPTVHMNALCITCMCNYFQLTDDLFILSLSRWRPPFPRYHSVMGRAGNASLLKEWQMATARCLLIHSFLSCLASLDYSKSNINIAQVAFSYMSHYSLHSLQFASRTFTDSSALHRQLINYRRNYL